MARPYRMRRRGTAADATRQRIVAAVAALHAEQGIAATTMKHIAQRAGVGIGTVYHHFPTYDDAIRACGAYTLACHPPPSAAIFAGLATPEQRVLHLARAVFDWFEAVPAFDHVRHDQDQLPVLRPAVAAEEENRRALMREALGVLASDETTVDTATALLDLGVYRALRRAGLTTAEAAQQISDVISTWAAHRPTHSRSA